MALDLNWDSVMYCFKKGQPCKVGSEQQAQLSVLNEPNLQNPFQDITDLDVEQANDANMVDPDDNRHWTTKIFRLYSSADYISLIHNLFFHLTPRANYECSFFVFF